MVTGDIEPMKKKDVPQDLGTVGDHGKEICYAVNDNGRYELVPSLGWKPKNIANDQAWEIIHSEISDTLQLIHKGKRSPLAYHMVRNQMETRLLAKYVRLSRLKVKRHLKPAVFGRLDHRLLKRYATVFDISVEELLTVPKSFQTVKKDILKKNEN